MAKRSDLPKFGPAQGIKVLSTGSRWAGPFVGTLLSDFGADVIQVESTIIPELFRSNHDLFTQVQRGHRNIALNIFSEQGRPVFEKLIKDVDIWIESGKGDTYARKGFSDDYIWSLNPKLVCVHVTGFGLTGVPEYVNRGSNDAIGQAFSGYMYLNGLPEPCPPLAAVPQAGDYFSPLYTCIAALLAYIRAQETGVGESIDSAQYETNIAPMAECTGKFLNEGTQVERRGNRNDKLVGYDSFKCKDGKYVFLGLAWGAYMPAVYRFLHMDDVPNFEISTAATAWSNPAALIFEERLKNYCASVTADEAESTFIGFGAPVAKVNKFEDVFNLPHVKERNIVTEYFDPNSGRMLKEVGPLPKLRNNPGKIWKGAPTLGMDNEDILGDLGYTAEEIAALYESGTLKQDNNPRPQPGLKL